MPARFVPITGHTDVPAGAQAACWLLPAESLRLWLFPALFLGGVVLQLVYLRLRRPWLLLAGAALTLGAAALDRDLSLAVGQVMAAAGFALLGRTSAARPERKEEKRSPSRN